jgi:RNA polymerase sigma-70 factor (ECF subfamily)
MRAKRVHALSSVHASNFVESDAVGGQPELAREPCSRAEPDFARAYASHGRALFAHCTRLLGDCSSAEDAVQEVFLRWRRHAARAPRPPELRPWLFRIATNHCLNELRRRTVRAHTPPQLALRTTHDLEDALAAQNDARRFLASLPPRARAIAWLTYVDGMLQHEVAETLGVSRRTVVNHLRQVRARSAT